MTSFIELRGVSKSFGALRALRPIDLDVAAGEVIGLVGENGAGKSTLIKLLSGVYPPDAGVIRLSGRALELRSPRDALAAGVATIHQELDVFAQLSVAENMLMGEPWPRRPWGSVHWRALYAEAGRRLAGAGLSIDPARSMEALTAAEKQEVAIAGALSRQARLLILDEPTASLSEPEVERLIAQVERLRQRGIAVLYVSHRLDEVFRLADRILVLRDGELVALHPTRGVTVAQIVREMIGRPLEQVYPRTRRGGAGAALLQVNRLSRSGLFHDVSFHLGAGEIVGLAGRVGAGRSELARAIYGLYRATSGTMRLGGDTWRPRDPRDALRAGLAYVPEERKRQGLVLDHSLAEAISIGVTDRLARWGLVPRRAESLVVNDAVARYDIRAASRTMSVGALSGGNQQKALLARWLERGPDVLILDEPTRGVDVGAKAQIHALLDQLAAAGKAVLFISSDLHEVIGMSDRLLVMNRGTIETVLRGPEMTEQNVILAASGMYRPQGGGR